MDDILGTNVYIKVKGRYKPIERCMLHLYDTGRPAEGIWWIRKNQSTWIGENPTPERIRNEPLREIISNVVCEKRYKPLSAMDIATLIVDKISEFQMKDKNICEKV